MRRPLWIFALLGTLTAGCWNAAPETPVSRGKAFFDDGNWDLAIAEFDKAIALNPLDSVAFLYRGQAYMCRGREFVGQALADYTEAIRLDPKCYEAYYHRAIAFRERGEKQKALADELVARRLDPNAEKAALMRAAPTPEEYKAAFERAAKEEGGETEAGSSSDVVLGAVPDLKSPKATAKEDVAGADQGALFPGTTLTDRKTPGSAAGQTTADAAPTYGLPVPNFRIGSMTEEMLGLDAEDAEHEDGEGFRSRGFARGRRPAPDWQSAAPPLAQPMAPTSPPPAQHRSPIGSLPFGNPFQPHTSGYSPYSTGPRSTGIQSGMPALPNQPFYRGGTSSYGNRSFDPNAVRPNPGR